jgi:hypothetical protein
MKPRFNALSLQADYLKSLAGGCPFGAGTFLGAHQRNDPSAGGERWGHRV